jgi:hypothetical protein
MRDSVPTAILPYRTGLAILRLLRWFVKDVSWTSESMRTFQAVVRILQPHEAELSTSQHRDHGQPLPRLSEVRSVADMNNLAMADDGMQKGRCQGGHGCPCLGLWWALAGSDGPRTRRHPLRTARLSPDGVTNMAV